jgi:hypothetical protein
MSSGWPPEDDDRRWEPARHPSAVGAVHDSRDAERGYSGFAHYDPEGQYPEGQYADDQYAGGEEGGWYGAPESGYQGPDYQPEPDNAGNGQVSYPDVYDLGAPANGRFPAQAGYPGEGYTEHPSFPNLPAQQAYGAPVAADYEQGYQEGYQQDGYQAGYAEPDYGAVEYHQHQAPAGASQPDYGYQDYGDPRYNDPGFGDPAYEDAPYAGYGAPASSYPDYPSYPEGSGYEYPPSYDADTDPGYAAPGQGYAVPESAPAGYVAAEYASGQFPARVGTLGELSAGMPDPAATGMLGASGMLDATGVSDRAELYNYHPGAGAEASHTFAGAPAPAGVLDASGLAPAPDDTMIDGHAPILDPAEAADHTGVLDGGTASTYFDPASFGSAPALAAGTAAPEFETAAAPGAPGAASPPAFTEAGSAEITSLDLPPAGSFDLGPGDGASRTGGTGALLRPRSTRPAGRRRGASGDRRLWVALGGVLLVAAVAITAIVMVAFPSGPGGPAHTLVTPNQLNAFTRRPALEQQMNVSQLRKDVVNMSSGQASHVVEGVYESGSSTSGSTPQIILFIGGNLANASPVDSVASFTKRFKGATVTSAGTLAGKAVCVNATASEPGSVAMCAWFDNDSFGEVVSPTMKAATLANAMRQIRPKVELIAPKKP